MSVGGMSYILQQALRFRRWLDTNLQGCPYTADVIYWSQDKPSSDNNGLAVRLTLVKDSEISSILLESRVTLDSIAHIRIVFRFIVTKCGATI